MHDACNRRELHGQDHAQGESRSRDSRGPGASRSMTARLPHRHSSQQRAARMLRKWANVRTIAPPIPTDTPSISLPRSSMKRASSRPVEPRDKEKCDAQRCVSAPAKHEGHCRESDGDERQAPLRLMTRQKADAHCAQRTGKEGAHDAVSCTNTAGEDAGLVHGWTREPALAEPHHGWSSGDSEVAGWSALADESAGRPD